MSGIDLSGRTALVTGGAQGLGEGMARALAAAGAAVMIGDLQEELGTTTAASIAEGGAKAAATRLDVTDEASWEAAISATVDQLGGLDILVNNAGIEITSLLVDLEPKAVTTMLQVNVLGTALGIKHAFRAMRPDGAAGKGGSIVNIASVAATIAFPGIAGYSATKSAVDRLTKVAAQESGTFGYGVRVNCVYPGLVPTAMGVGLAQDMVTHRSGRGPRRRRRPGGRSHPARPARRGRGHGRRRRVPGVRPGEVHHRRGPAGRRRDGDVTTA